MKNNKGFALIPTLLIIIGVLIVGGGMYYLGTRSSTEIIPENETYYPPVNQNTLPVTNNSPQTNPPANPAGGGGTSPQNCSTWATFNGAYVIKYPSCWIASNITGGSYGTANSAVGVLLKPSINSSSNDSISIGGWQYDCSMVNVSGGNNPATKAYCIADGDSFTGQYITSSNQGTIYGSPVVTWSTNSQVLNTFDLIIQQNIQ